MKSVASLNASLLSTKGTAAPAPLKPTAVPLGPAEPPTGLPPEPHPAASGRGEGHDGHEQVKFSLRLDRDQHLKIRLASVHMGQSAQALILAALDRYLEQVAPELVGGCRCLAPSDWAP